MSSRGVAPLKPAPERSPVRPPVPPGPYLVAGLGRAGCAAVDALVRALGADQVAAWDRDASKPMRRRVRELEAKGVRTHLGRHPPELDATPPARTLVKSPGISGSTPIFKLARKQGVEVLDELELGWRLSSTPMVAVTGTNGKSTVAGLAVALLSASGRRVRLVGNTEFGPALSAVAVERLDWTVCEVSSYQLEGCPALLPEVAVLTNLTGDHLHRHRSMRRYGELKRRLFVRGDRVVPMAVIDVDDPFGRELAAEVQWRGGQVARIGFSADADYRVEESTWDLRGGTVRVSTPIGQLEARTRLPGSYNARNVGAALAVADALGVERSLVAPTLAAHRGPPGRFEHIDEGQDHDVIVDFAHTPEGVEQFLLAVREGMDPRGRLLAVLGLTGRARAAKMHGMGRVARTLADELVLTTSGFRGEPPLRALQGMLHGARAEVGARVEVVLDRRKAIDRALRSAMPHDVVVIVGRGAETMLSLDPKGRPLPFDDREVAREILLALSPNRAGVRSSPA